MVRNCFLEEIKRVSLGMVLKWIEKINQKEHSMESEIFICNPFILNHCIYN